MSACRILWALNHPDVWFIFVGERGWTPAQYEEWLADTACAQLLGHTKQNSLRSGSSIQK